VGPCWEGEKKKINEPRLSRSPAREAFAKTSDDLGKIFSPPVGHPALLFKRPQTPKKKSGIPPNAELTNENNPVAVVRPNLIRENARQPERRKKKLKVIDQWLTNQRERTTVREEGG